MSKPFIMFTGFILIVVMATISSITATELSPSPKSRLFIDDLKTRYPDLPIGNIAKCIITVTTDVQACALDIVNYLLTVQIHKSPMCCRVVRNVDEKCLRTVLLNDLPFANVISPLIEGLKYSIMNVVCPEIVANPGSGVYSRPLRHQRENRTVNSSGAEDRDQGNSNNVRYDTNLVNNIVLPNIVAGFVSGGYSRPDGGNGYANNGRHGIDSDRSSLIPDLGITPDSESYPRQDREKRDTELSSHSITLENNRLIQDSVATIKSEEHHIPDFDQRASSALISYKVVDFDKREANLVLHDYTLESNNLCKRMIVGLTSESNRVTPDLGATMESDAHNILDFEQRANRAMDSCDDVEVGKREVNPVLHDSTLKSSYLGRRKMFDPG